jgi:hypothetical protein
VQVVYKPGDVIIEHGTPGATVCWLMKGRVSVARPYDAESADAYNPFAAASASSAAAAAAAAPARYFCRKSSIIATADSESVETNHSFRGTRNRTKSRSCFNDSSLLLFHAERNSENIFEFSLDIGFFIVLIV